MPYKNQKKRLEYARKWRQKHSTYMRDYGRKYYALGLRPKKPAMLEVT